jgi:hypothetical protein
MLPPAVEIRVPKALLDRVDVHGAQESRELVTFLLERYAQDREKTRRVEAYRRYYESRTDEDRSEEAELLSDFSASDAEVNAEWDRS